MSVMLLATCLDLFVFNVKTMSTNGRLKVIAQRSCYLSHSTAFMVSFTHLTALVNHLEQSCYHVGKEASVAEKLEWDGNDERADEEKTREHEHVRSVRRSVTSTAKQDAIQLLACRLVQCRPVNHIISFCTIPSTTFWNHTKLHSYYNWYPQDC